MCVCVCLFEVEVSVFVCLFVSIKSYVFLSILFEVCICVYMCLVCVYVFPRVFAESLACMKLFLFIFDCKKKIDLCISFNIYSSTLQIFIVFRSASYQYILGL